MSQEDQRKKKKLVTRLETILKTQRSLNVPQNRIMILSIDPEIDMVELIKFGIWLLRGDSKPSEKEITEESLCSDISLTLLGSPDNNDGQIICADLQWFELFGYDSSRPQENQSLSEKMYYFEFLKNLLKNARAQNNSSCRIYLACQERRTSERTQKFLGKFMELLQQISLGVIYVRHRGLQTISAPNLNTIYLGQENFPLNKERVSFVDIIKEQKHDELSPNYNLSSMKKSLCEELLSISKKQREELESFVLKCLSPVKKIVQGINDKQIQDPSLLFKEIIDLIICYDDLPTENLEQLPLMKSVFKISQPPKIQQKNEQMINQGLSKLVFLSEFRKIYDEFVEDYHNFGQSLSRVKQFFKDYFAIFKFLGSLSNEDISKMYNLIYIILQSSQIFKGLTNDNNRQFLTLGIINEIQGFIPKCSVVLSILMKQPIKINGPVEYYDELDRILAQNLKRNDYYSQNNYEQTKAELNQMKTKILFYRSTQCFKLYSHQKNNKKKAEGVRSLLLFYKENMEMDFLQILRKCAEQLKNIGRTDLALEIYMKLEMIYAVEDCSREILMECSQNQQSQFYIRMSQYFDTMNQKNLSEKYLQLAYQLDINSGVSRTNFFQNNSGYSEFILFGKQFWIKIQRLVDQIEEEVPLQVTIHKNQFGSALKCFSAIIKA